NRFVVLRGSVDASPGGRLPVILAPGQAFGSGEHETTRSCLEELEKIPLAPQARVLDLGSGTGILAVAAARLGVHSVIALDPSPEAAKTTLATIRLNGMGKVIFPVQGEIVAIRGAQFDLITANLFGDLLLRIADLIHSLMKPGAHLLLSGILWGDAYDVKTVFTRAGCVFLRDQYLEEYCTLLLRKSAARL
ncbi:MAG: 50S ribosomal protein L11 methyltransferase, partial [Acidobacteriota bacterium]